MESNSTRIQKNLKIIRKRILQASFNSKDGHIPSAFSILEILWAIFIEVPKKTQLVLNSDFEVVLSKGHASMALYGILEEIGVIDSEWIHSFGQFDSDFGGHPDSRKIPAVILSSGSLGHGLPFAVGRILANRMGGVEKRVIVIVGDGELNEGSNWEALMLAEAHQLSELLLIVDFNNSTDRSLPISNLKGKLEQFGFHSLSVQGHDVEQIVDAATNDFGEGPTAIIANTTKGFGIKDMENNHAWHHSTPSQEQMEKFLEELS